MIMLKYFSRVKFYAAKILETNFGKKMSENTGSRQKFAREFSAFYNKLTLAHRQRRKENASRKAEQKSENSRRKILSSEIGSAEKIIGRNAEIIR